MELFIKTLRRLRQACEILDETISELNPTIKIHNSEVNQWTLH